MSLLKAKRMRKKSREKGQETAWETISQSQERPTGLPGSFSLKVRLIKIWVK